MAQDAVSLIMSDHREVEGLFASFAGPAPADERAQIVGRIIRELSVHAAVEEMILYPAVRREVADGERLADEAIREHQELKELLAELDGLDVADDRVPDIVGRVEAAVTEHVEEEEGELLPSLQSALRQDELEDMGRRIERAKAAAPTRPHPHAPDSPPGNMIVGVPAGLVDRVRDALDPTR
jgi:hemerythrin superfamily protein